MKRTVLFAVSSFVPLLLSAQAVKYAYDATGNRINRSVVTATKAVSEEAPPPEMMTERLSQNNLTVFPNPTDGPLTVKVADFKDGDVGTIDVFNASGATLSTTKVTGTTTELNLSGQPTGIYFVNVTLNGEQQTREILS